MELHQNWLAEYGPAVSLDILRTMALMHIERVPMTVREAREIRALIRRDDLLALCSYDLDPNREGWNPQDLYHCRQALAFFTKLEPLDLGIDREAAALASFEASEDLCKSTNEIFRLHRQGRFCFDPLVEAWIYQASRKIARVLGPVPPSFTRLAYRFGKGATTITKKKDASVRSKCADGVSCSEALLPVAAAILEELPALCEVWAAREYSSESCNVASQQEESWYSVPVQIMEGRLEFVPKSYKTKRSTVTEPSLNGLIQLAQGDDLAVRLRRVGLDIRDQTRNQRLAKDGSKYGDLATIDLSSASDTIALELVYHLLPLDWATYLARSRSGKILVRGQVVKLEKFSSMGNGYTFPLETLIFWALASSACDNDPRVIAYGDDIIVPSKKFENVVRLLKAVGFIPNEKKSFSRGPFRESCGADFYSGIDVRPYFQKKWISAATLFTLHNFYVRRGMDDFARQILEYLHPVHNLWGPDGYGDGHLIGDFAYDRKPSHLARGFGGFTFKSYSRVARKDLRPEMQSDKAVPLYLVEHSDKVPLLEGRLLSHWDKYPRGFFHKSAKGQVSESTPCPLNVATDKTQVKAPNYTGLDLEVTYKRNSIYAF